MVEERARKKPNYLWSEVFRGLFFNFEKCLVGWQSGFSSLEEYTHTREEDYSRTWAALFVSVVEWDWFVKKMSCMLNNLYLDQNDRRSNNAGKRGWITPDRTFPIFGRVLCSLKTVNLPIFFGSWYICEMPGRAIASSTHEEEKTIVTGTPTSWKLAVFFSQTGKTGHRC